MSSAKGDRKFCLFLMWNFVLELASTQKGYKKIVASTSAAVKHIGISNSGHQNVNLKIFLKKRS